MDFLFISTLQSNFVNLNKIYGPETESGHIYKQFVLSWNQTSMIIL